MQEQHEEQGRSAASVRAVELATATAIILLGALVSFDSFRLGARWGEDGPQAGYFPFYVGLLICISGAAVFLQSWRARALAEESFVERGQLRTIFIVLVPTAVYVALIAWLGFYVASTIYIALFMRVLGRYGWIKTAAVSVGVSVFFFLIFETWFQVPLPKGPLEAAFGLA